jgi:hypothetical protein
MFIQVLQAYAHLHAINNFYNSKVNTFFFFHSDLTINALVVASSPAMLNKTSSDKHKRMVLRALASRSSQSSFVMLVSFFVLPQCLLQSLLHSKSRILSFHNSKLFFR